MVLDGAESTEDDHDKWNQSVKAQSALVSSFINITLHLVEFQGYRGLQRVSREAEEGSRGC